MPKRRAVWLWPFLSAERLLPWTQSSRARASRHPLHPCTKPDRTALIGSRGWGKVTHSAFHEDNSLPVISSSLSISVL